MYTSLRPLPGGGSKTAGGASLFPARGPNPTQEDVPLMLAVMILLLVTHLLILFVLLIAVAELSNIEDVLGHIARTFSSPVEAPEGSADEERRGR